MRPFVLAMAGACTLAVVLIGVGQAAGIALDYALGRYPGSARLAGQRLQLRALPGGYLRHDGAYRTSDNLTTIVAWYSGRSGIEPGPSMYADGRCVKLSQVNRHSLFQHALAVTICAAQHSTSVYVSQTAAVIPFAPARRQ